MPQITTEFYSKSRPKNAGFGILEAMVYLVIISIVVAVSLDFLSQSRTQEALRRRNSLTKKSFGGAEMIMIDQRQCRCNLLNRSFDWDIAKNETIELDRLKTFADVNGCTDNKDLDIVLSDTTGDANLDNESNKILITDIKAVIPRMLYRAIILVAPKFGRPVEFPVLLNTHPINADEVIIDICGVDRAS